MYVLLVLFLTGQQPATVEYRKVCPTWACVQEVIESAPGSRRVSRIRVYEGQPTLLPGTKSVFPPLLDYWRQ